MSYLDILARILEWGIALYGYTYFKSYLDSSKEKKAKLENGIGKDFDRKSKIFPILDEIRLRLEADRVQEWVFSNGEKTLNGHHLKKVSIFIEANSDAAEKMGDVVDLVPSRKFERNLEELNYSPDDAIVSHEFEHYDELAAFYADFNIKSILMIKIKNDIGQWVGNLVVCNKEFKNFTEGDIAFCKLMASRIGAIK